jgi:PhnB protein
MKVDPYLHYNGNCEEAFRFYEQALGGKIEMMMTYDQAPPGGGPTPPGWEKKVMHVRLSLGDQIIMASDAPPGHFSPMQGFCVSLAPDSKDKAEKIFNALADKGKVMMPFQKTFWSDGFGMVTDRFGTPWMVNFTGGAQVG